MFFDNYQPLFLLMQFLVILYNGWNGVRTLASAYFPTAINCWFERDREDFTAPVWHADARDFPDRLRALGFEPLGIKAEDSTSPLNIIREFVWVSPSQHAFASILAHTPHKFYFYTPFRDGSIVLTSNADRFRNARGERVAIQVDPVGTPENLLVTHLSLVDELQAEGHTPYSEFTQASRLKSNPYYFESVPGRRRLLNHGFLLLSAAALLSWGFIFFMAKHVARSDKQQSVPAPIRILPDRHPLLRKPQPEPVDRPARIIPLEKKAG